MSKYLIAIDFASKLGWSVWDVENKQLIKVGVFNFINKNFKKQFKNSGFQDKIYEKTIFEKEQTKQLVDEILKDIPEKTEIKILVEYSDFGFKYVIEHLSRLLTLLFIEINSRTDKYNFSIQKIIAVTWRKYFRNSNTDIDFSKYEESKTKNNKTRKQINWKTLAADWVNQYIKNINIEIDFKLLSNSDIVDSIIIGYTFLNYMNI